MYWHNLTEEEIERANRQAEAQAADSKKVGKSTKFVGNLGEIAFQRFLEHTLGDPGNSDPTWEYYNEPAMKSADTEYNSADFKLGWCVVDVKTADDIRKFAPEKMYNADDRDGHWILNHQDGHPKVDESSNAVYVFVLLDDHPPDVETGKVATILGWAGINDIAREKNNWLVTSGGPRLSLRNLPELLTQAGFPPRATQH